VSAHFGNQHISLVIPIIDYISFFVTGGLTNARKRLFNLHLMNTEDHLFPHNGLRANIFSTLDTGPSYSMIGVINNSREAFRVNESKYL
jgi:hypothetical protein